MCYEMCELVPGMPDPGVFEVPQGARRSGPLEGFGLLSPSNAVKGAAGPGVAGCRGAGGLAAETSAKLIRAGGPATQKRILITLRNTLAAWADT